MEAGLSLEKALTQLINKLNGWVTLTVKMLPNLVVAVILLVIIVKLSRPMAKLVARAVKQKRDIRSGLHTGFPIIPALNIARKV